MKPFRISVILILLTTFLTSCINQNTPSVTLDVVSTSIDEIVYELTETDPTDSGEIVEVRLFQYGEIISINTPDETTFESLRSNTEYEIEVVYRYNQVESETTYTVFTKEITTPTISYEEVFSRGGNIYVHYDIQDPYQVGNIALVQLFQGETLVEEKSDDFAFFSNIITNQEYTLKTVYQYDLNDGLSKRETLIETSLYVPFYEGPSFSLEDVWILDDSIYYSYNENDPDQIGTIKSVVLYQNNEEVTRQLSFYENVIPFVPSGENYTLKIVYEINLYNGEEPQSITFQKTGLTVDTRIQDAFDYLDVLYRQPVTANLSLPTFEEDPITAGYETTCGVIERNRIVYSNPQMDFSCEVDVSLYYKGQEYQKSYDLIVLSEDNLPKIPSLHITTQGNAPVYQNKEYVQATLDLVLNNNDDYLLLDDVNVEIRTRGNSTLGMPKLSFKLHFEEKQYLLSGYKEKSWVLLANYSDQTLVRNAVAFQLSKDMGMAFTPSIHFVDVYLNGEYLGNYMLTDYINVTSDRVQIEENVPDIDTGYLIELDRGLYREGLDNTNDNYFLIGDIPFVIKSPDSDDDHYQEEHKDYIQNYMEEVFSTLANQQDYHHLIDEASFIDWFIINELFKNVDSGYSSVYYYKQKGGLLYMGPVWDFDLSTGNQGHVNSYERGPTGWYTPLEYKNILFYYLFQYPDFMENLQSRWNEVYKTAIQNTLDNVFYYADSITYSRIQNFERWDIIGTNYQWYTASEVYDLKTYDEQVWFLYDYLVTRIEWLNNEFN